MVPDNPMPRLNFWIILAVVLLSIPCSGITLRDRVLLYSLHRIEKNSLVEPSAEELFEGAMSGMVRKLHAMQDDYSAYIPRVKQKEYEEGLDNRFDGIGIIYRRNPVGKKLEVIYPILHSPAYQAGLRSGDGILEVDGKTLDDLSFAEASDLFKGSVGKEIRLTVLPFGREKPIHVNVRREPIRRDSVEGDGIDANGRRIFHLESEPEIGYVRITSFSDLTAEEVRNALKSIRETKTRGLILDLRDNPGGYVAVCVETVGLFMAPTPEQNIAVSTRYRNGDIKGVYHISNQEHAFTGPMVVLVDGESASAAEILSACLQDYHRATVVGARSFGKGTVQEILPLPLNSGTIQLTDASYWRPSNRNIHRSHNAKESDQWGVTPDPEGLLSLSELQRFASLQIRERRSNVVTEDRKAVLAAYLQELPVEIELYRQELDQIRQKTKEQEEWGDFMESSDGENFDDMKNEAMEPVEEKPQPAVQDVDEPFTLHGNAPYFDPQLDRAIELLKKKL